MLTVTDVNMYIHENLLFRIYIVLFLYCTEEVEVPIWVRLYIEQVRGLGVGSKSVVPKPPPSRRTVLLLNTSKLFEE